MDAMQRALLRADPQPPSVDQQLLDDPGGVRVGAPRPAGEHVQLVELDARAVDGCLAQQPRLEHRPRHVRPLAGADHLHGRRLGRHEQVRERHAEHRGEAVQRLDRRVAAPRLELGQGRSRAARRAGEARCGQAAGRAQAPHVGRDRLDRVVHGCLI